MAGIETLYWLYNRTNRNLSGTVDSTRDRLDIQQFIHLDVTSLNPKLKLLIKLDCLGQAVNNPTSPKLTELERLIFTAACREQMLRRRRRCYSAARETALECKPRP
jgi:7-keto-8-aminopelargonate synthetase-like enzyme